MSAAERCDMELLVQAEFDGELDAAQAASLAAHRADCPICQDTAAQLAQTRDLLQIPGLYRPAPQAVRQRILAQLGANRPPAPQPRRNWFAGWGQGWTGFGLGAACAASVAFLLLAPAGQSLTDDVVSGHIRALQPGHLEDVVSTDRHTVKPWFDGRLDFAPPVKDLVADGFPLKGGRLDYVGGRPVAALVYQRDKHLIDLFVWPESGNPAAAPASAERSGYNVVHWSDDGMALWAVSDLEMSQLVEFAKDWRELR
jgi:anti-sigma factor RsiW